MDRERVVDWIEKEKEGGGFFFTLDRIVVKGEGINKLSSSFPRLELNCQKLIMRPRPDKMDWTAFLFSTLIFSISRE